MIRITLKRAVPNKTTKLEFEDEAHAAARFVEVFDAPYVTKATWERVEPGAEHTSEFKPAQVTMVYTFGYGTDRRDRFVEITAETAEHCRAIMLNHFGTNWAFDYPSREKAGVGRFGLYEIPRAEWPPSSDLYAVDESGRCVPR